MQPRPELKSIYRTHTCHELRAGHSNSIATLSGWVHRRRDHGGVVFIDLRDHYGITQIVFSGAVAEKAVGLKNEYVIQVTGKVVTRGQGLVNQNLATGEIELAAQDLFIHSTSEQIPFSVADDDGAPDSLRLKYRFIELRREKLHSSIVMRSKIISAMRKHMTDAGFLEYQTPILTASSPEGARDFVVPSRLHPHKFYALPQAPQQFKQLLMVSGFDRYFQIAPCFRDEDARADRSPGEFYQLDMELSFVTQDDVLAVNEYMIERVFKEFSKHPVTSAPYPRIPYRDAMSRYGSDKPDLRNPLEISDLSLVFAETQFKVFRAQLDTGGWVKGIWVEVKDTPARKQLDDLVQYFTELTGGGLAYLTINGEEQKGSIGKFISEDEWAKLRATFGANGVLFIAAGKDETLLKSLGKLRDKLGDDFNKTEKNQFKFCWITDFPFYEQDEQTGAVQFGHNPFSMPRGGLEALENTAPLEILANQYDMVCNGYELGSGAIRNHSAEVMFKAFEIVGYDRAEVEKRFGGMLRAFQFGAPPHGGFAHGVDRIVMLLCNEEAIRDVIAFPLNQNGEDLLMGAPCEATDKQLREVHIQLKQLPKKEIVHG